MSQNPRPQAVSPGLPRSPEDIVSFRSPIQADTSSATQARQTVQDAIAPMRRGRPNLGGVGVAPPANGVYVSDDLDLPTPRGGHFKSVTTSERWTSAAREAPAALGGSARPNPMLRPSQEWMQEPRVAKEEPKAQKSPWDGLGSLENSEKGAMNGFGDAFNPTPLSNKQSHQNSTFRSPPANSSASSSSSPSIQPFQQQQQQQQATYQPPNLPPPTTATQSRFTMPTPSRLLQAPRVPIQTKPKDSLGDIASSTSAPSASMMMRPPSNASTHNGLVSAFSRPSTAADSVVSDGTGLSSAAVVEGVVALSAADRFPSIEQLESVTVRERPHAPLFRPRSPLGPRAPSPARPNFSALSRPPAYAGLSRMSYTGGLALDHEVISPPPPIPLSGVRSQQVTGTAMKGTVPAAPPLQSSAAAGSTKPNIPQQSSTHPSVLHTPATPTRFPILERPPSRFPTAERPIAPNRKPIVARRRGNTMELKVDNSARENMQQMVEHDLLGPGPPAGTQPLVTQRTPSPSAVPQRDWLMDEDIVLQPMIKASTGSMQPRLPTPDTTYVDPNKAKRATMGTALISFGKGPIGVVKNSLMESTVAGWQRGVSNIPSAYQAPMGPPPTSFTTNSGVALPGLAKRPSQEGSPVRRRSNTTSRISQSDPPPPSLPPRPQQQQQPRGPSPQPRRTPTSLTENWSPVEQRFPPTAKSTFGEAQTGADSSGEEGPEDVQSSTLQQMRWREQDRQVQPMYRNLRPQMITSNYRTRNSDSSPKQQHQARQGSVHGLVDLWSGASKPTGGQKDQEEATQPSQRLNHRREPSKDLMKFPETSESGQTPGQQSYSRAMHLFPPLDAIDRRPSPSSGSGSEKDTDAPRPQPPQKRFSGSKARPTQLSIDRMRPQSLFISAGAPSPGSGPNQLGYLRNSPPDSLSVPSPTNTSGATPLNRQRSPRRTSISDMVSRFEALSAVSPTTSGYTASNESGPASPKAKPAVSMKPASLRSGMQSKYQVGCGR